MPELQCALQRSKWNVNNHQLHSLQTAAPKMTVFHPWRDDQQPQPVNSFTGHHHDPSKKKEKAISTAHDRKTQRNSRGCHFSGTSTDRGRFRRLSSGNMEVELPTLQWTLSEHKSSISKSKSLKKHAKFLLFSLHLRQCTRHKPLPLKQHGT